MTDGEEVPVLHLERVSKVYEGPPRVEALRDVDLDVRRGELVAIVGPSGSGKSTLLHMMGALDAPTSGTVRIDGRAVSELDDAEVSGVRAFKIGFVFQQFFLITGLSTVDNVAQGLLYQGVPASERTARAEEALRRVGLGHRLTHAPSQLSGGERQRVAIARALVSEPSILLADEPTGNLDSASTKGIIGLFRELNEQGVTIIVITHEHDIADSFPRTVHITDGRLSEPARGATS